MNTYTREQLLNVHASGVWSDAQTEALIWASIYQTSRYGRDRRAGGMEVKVDPKTGLPLSGNDLATGHRVVTGIELVLASVINPRNFVLENMLTDELPENATLSHDSENREWRSLTYVSPDTWSDDTIFAVKENTRRVKLFVERHGQHFDPEPMIGDGQSVTGEKLVKGEDGMTMGFKIRYSAIKEAEDFVKAHPWYMRRTRAAEVMGKLLDQAPEWKQGLERHEDTTKLSS